MSFRRYEILLPIRHNDATPVGEEVFAETRRDLVQAFGAVTWHPDRLHGVWSHGGQVFEDMNVKVVVDVEDTAETQDFFRRFKQTIKTRFHQIDIWMISYEIQVH